MEFLEKGTFVDVSSDIAERLLQEYGAFFEKSGQEIIVSQDNTIKMDDSGRMYFKKPNGSWEEILLTNENEEVEEVEEETDTDGTGEEKEEEDVERERDVRMKDGNIEMDDFDDEDIDYDSWQENEQR